MMNMKSRGFTLIEVMIALFVLSVGMLGSTAMMLRGQREAVKVNHDGTAMQLASNMAERIRSNVSGVSQNAYDALVAGQPNPGCISTGCSALNRATYDSYLWGQELGELPNGTGSVDLVSIPNPSRTNDRLFQITVSWTEVQRTGTNTGAEVTKNYVMMFQP